MLKYPKPRYDHHYLVPQQRIPGYLPYPNPVSPGNIPVPNASSIDWPQAQFAPKFFPAGSKSFQPYRYPDYQHDVSLGGLYEEGTEFAEDNPLYMDTTQILWLAAAATLGYFTAKKGWDHKLRAFVKSKL